ncbi:hypothetical protein HK096_004215, partial [Nowakowskiella sp. JEL0078]
CVNHLSDRNFCSEDPPPTPTVEENDSKTATPSNDKTISEIVDKKDKNHKEKIPGGFPDLKSDSDIEQLKQTEKLELPLSNQTPQVPKTFILHSSMYYLREDSAKKKENAKLKASMLSMFPSIPKTKIG